ncbi:ArsR/SmtB family transcription factor [Alienimonas californiensis]|uniref:Transcriptional repressor SdpR n=1 Tax=Alienimonas californiensis TaxID=2527989 RepID=A0A517P509_9PLAN|nr:metalloregulator ArsR/SmtB family transcription factor [Alienimonas californiensis]QDT14473.1 Transcriptional repressor SdpR [Alienimonas californiensis]
MPAADAPLPQTSPPPGDRLQSEMCSEKLKALGEPTRLRIVDLLRDGPANVSEIAESLQLPVVTTSHHLQVLAHAALVDRKKAGRKVVYSLPLDLLPASDAGHLNLGCCRLELPTPAADAV